MDYKDLNNKTLRLSTIFKLLITAPLFKCCDVGWTNTGE